MYYIEVLFVYGDAQLRTFYGPFDTAELRNYCIDIVKKVEQECFEDYTGLEQRGKLMEDNHFLDIINPAHTKYLLHNGALPKGSWVKKPLEIPGWPLPTSWCWYIEQEMNDWLIKTAKHR
jgi:hypothetical protein